MPSADAPRRALSAQVGGLAAAALAACASGALLVQRKAAAQRVPMRNAVAPGDWDSFEQLEAEKQARPALAHLSSNAASAHLLHSSLRSASLPSCSPAC